MKPVKHHQTGQETGGGALPVSSVSFLTQVHQSVQMSQRILKLKQQEEGAHESGSPNPTSHHEVRFFFFFVMAEIRFRDAEDFTLGESSVNMFSQYPRCLTKHSVTNT